MPDMVLRIERCFCPMHGGHQIGRPLHQIGHVEHVGTDAPVRVPGSRLNDRDDDLADGMAGVLEHRAQAVRPALRVALGFHHDTPAALQIDDFQCLPVREDHYAVARTPGLKRRIERFQRELLFHENERVLARFCLIGFDPVSAVVDVHLGRVSHFVVDLE